MSKHYAVCVALVSSVLAPLLQGAAPQQLGEIVGDDVYTNCEYRVAAQFPGEPKIRDITYRDGARTAPARQFYVERPIGPLSVTVVHFADGPDWTSRLSATPPRPCAGAGRFASTSPCSTTMRCQLAFPAASSKSP